jgi:hypothetical protein
MPITYSRLDTIHPLELPYWRWRTLHTFMQEKMSGRDFNTYLVVSATMGYIPAFDMAENDGTNALTRVRYRDAVDFLEKFVVPVAALLDWGHAADNPVGFVESRYAVDAIKAELRRLEGTREMLRLDGLVGRLEDAAGRAFKPHVVRDKKYNLGNPIFPPGYEAYRKYLCEWTAKGCFIHPSLVQEHKKFVARMHTERGVWWKGHPFLRG